MSILTLGAELANTLPYLEDEIAKMEHQLEYRVFALIREGKLTPEVALQAWMEKNAYHLLISKFQQKIKIGVSMAQQASLDIDSQGQYIS